MSHAAPPEQPHRAGKLQAWHQLRRELGSSVACLYAANKLLHRLGGGARIVPYALYAQPVGAGYYAAVRDDPVTVVRQLGAADPLIGALPRPAAVLADRFAQGCECHAVTVKGVFAGTIWLSRRRHLEDEVRCDYVLVAPERSVWDFDVYVEPRFRLGRTMGRLWKSIDSRLAAEGVQWSFSRISLFNRASLLAHERLGAVRVAHAFFLVLGRFQLAIATRAPFVHLSLSESQRPRLRLQPPTDLKADSSQ